MFSVTGYLGQVAYTLNVDPDSEPGGPAALEGSPGIRAWLAAAVGEPVRATPTSALMPLDLADPVSILAALHQHTQVLDVIGAAPALHAPLDADDRPGADAVY